jgi:hypothetical protein
VLLLGQRLNQGGLAGLAGSVKQDKGKGVTS